MKTLKLQIVKLYRTIVVAQLEKTGRFKKTAHVRDGSDDLRLVPDGIILPAESNRIANCLEFVSNEERDKYAANLISWITKEQFGGAGKLEIGKMCLVKDSEDAGWAKRFYAGKVAKQLGTEKRHLAYSDPESDAFYRWDYAKPLKCTKPYRKGDVYTWQI